VNNITISPTESRDRLTYKNQIWHKIEIG